MSAIISRLSTAMLIPVSCALSLTGCTSSQSTLDVGSCIDSPQKISPVPCSQPHYGEIIGLVVVPGGDYPGPQMLASEAGAECRQIFADVIGTPTEQSIYDLFPLVPSETSWNDDDDRTVFCAVRSSTGELLTESVNQTNR